MLVVLDTYKAVCYACATYKSCISKNNVDPLHYHEHPQQSFANTDDLENCKYSLLPKEPQQNGVSRTLPILASSNQPTLLLETTGVGLLQPAESGTQLCISHCTLSDRVVIETEDQQQLTLEYHHPAIMSTRELFPWANPRTGEDKLPHLLEVRQPKTRMPSMGSGAGANNVTGKEGKPGKVWDYQRVSTGNIHAAEREGRGGTPLDEHPVLQTLLPQQLQPLQPVQQLRLLQHLQQLQAQPEFQKEIGSVERPTPDVRIGHTLGHREAWAQVRSLVGLWRA